MGNACLRKCPTNLSLDKEFIIILSPRSNKQNKNCEVKDKVKDNNLKLQEELSSEEVENKIRTSSKQVKEPKSLEEELISGNIEGKFQLSSEFEFKKSQEKDQSIGEIIEIDSSLSDSLFENNLYMNKSEESDSLSSFENRNFSYENFEEKFQRALLLTLGNLLKKELINLEHLDSLKISFPENESKINDKMYINNKIEEIFKIEKRLKFYNFYTDNLTNKQVNEYMEKFNEEEKKFPKGISVLAEKVYIGINFKMLKNGNIFIYSLFGKEK